jgi:hypothetical protein
MRLAFLPLLVCGALATNAFATDIYQNFIILEASDLDPVGGTFLQGGTYSGTFSVDVSDLPTGQNTVALMNVDVNTTALPGFTANAYTSGEIALIGVLTGGTENLDEYTVIFPLATDSLGLSFVEVAGTFEGGEIVFASEIQDLGSRLDKTGDAVAIDPAFLSPEPGSIGMGGLGLAILAGAWRRRNLGVRRLV